MSLFVNMFLRPFGSKRLRESYVFKYYSVLLQRYSNITNPPKDYKESSIQLYTEKRSSLSATSSYICGVGHIVSIGCCSGCCVERDISPVDSCYRLSKHGYTIDALYRCKCAWR